jgi:DNA ligase-1
MQAQIKRPMLAATLVFINDILFQVKKKEYIPFDPNNIPFPLLGTPKIDGIRCEKVKGLALSRSFKPISNKYIRERIESVCPDGFDGEIIVGKKFNDTSSGVMTQTGHPDFKYLVFDWLIKNSYADRMIQLRKQHYIYNKPKWVEFLIPVQINNMKELLSFEKKMIKAGHEGVMLRTPDSPYKFGRSTLKEFYLVKLIRRLEAEAVVIGFTELMHNDNEQEESELGYFKRSSKQEGMVGMNTLGALIVLTSDKIQFKLGSGFTAAQRKEIWRNRKKYISKICTYRYKPFGQKDKPRGATFKAWRADI